MSLIKINFKIVKKICIIINFYFFILFFSFISIPFIISARIFGIFFNLKILPINLDRIGRLYFLDLYLNKKQKKNNISSIDLFYIETDSFQPLVCNHFWKQLWSRRLNVFKNWYLGQSIKFFNNIIPFKKINFVKNFDDRIVFNSFNFKKNLISNDIKEKFNLSKRNLNSNISLSENEIEQGYKILKKFNITKQDKFVCISNRDQKYLEIEKKKNFTLSNFDFSYHEHRNSKISTYLYAAKFLVNQNYFVIRTGKYVEEKFNSTSKKIIDYSNSDIRSDFMDIFLASECKFYMCNDGGISILPYVFRKPIVYTNFISPSLIPFFYKKTLIIFKKVYCKIKKRFLSFQEINKLEDKFNSLSDPNFFKKNKSLYLVNNTQDEIKFACKEMDELVNNNWDLKKYKNFNQLKFWYNFMGEKNFDLKNKTLIVGNNFLKKNKSLLRNKI